MKKDKDVGLLNRETPPVNFGDKKHGVDIKKILRDLDGMNKEERTRALMLIAECDPHWESHL